MGTQAKNKLACKQDLQDALAAGQPHSQVLSPTHGETLVGSGHVSPRIWEITNKWFGGGEDKCEICLCRAYMENCVPDLALKVMTLKTKPRMPKIIHKILWKQKCNKLQNIWLLIYRRCCPLQILVHTEEIADSVTACAVKNNLYSSIHADRNVLDLNCHF